MVTTISWLLLSLRQTERDIITPRMASESGAEVVSKRKRKQWSNDSMLAAMEAVKLKTCRSF